MFLISQIKSYEVTPTDHIIDFKDNFLITFITKQETESTLRYGIRKGGTNERRREEGRRRKKERSEKR